MGSSVSPCSFSGSVEEEGMGGLGGGVSAGLGRKCSVSFCHCWHCKVFHKGRVVVVS